MGKAKKIDDLLLKRNVKIKSWIDISITYNQNIRIPIIYITGKETGKTLCITAATHGDEYEGVDAIIRLTNELEPSDLKGNLLAFPALNIIAFDDICRVGHYDFINLNRIFPGKEKGFLSERIANKIVNIIFNEIKIDALIDFHGGGFEKFIGPIATFSEVDKLEKDLNTMKIATLMGSKLLWKRNYPPSSIAGYCNTKGIPAIVFEAGGGGPLNTSIVSLEVNGIKNVMKYMNILSGEIENLQDEFLVVGGFLEHSKKGGFWRTTINKVGEKFLKGDFVGEIVDIQGNVIETFFTKTDGIVVCFRTYPKIHPGDWTYWVGPIIQNIRR